MQAVFSLPIPRLIMLLVPRDTPALGHFVCIVCMSCFFLFCLLLARYTLMVGVGGLTNSGDDVTRGVRNFKGGSGLEIEFGYRSISRSAVQGIGL
jgi:hypothetical protein